MMVLVSGKLSHRRISVLVLVVVNVDFSSSMWAAVWACLDSKEVFVFITFSTRRNGSLIRVPEDTGKKIIISPKGIEPR